MRYTVVIVGGGFSGTVLAVNLLRRPPSNPTDILLFERNARVGQGIAYAQRDFPYLLNVAAGRMSLDRNDPTDFLRFAQGRQPGAEAEDFLPRAWYGDYLEEALMRAEREAPAQVRLHRVHGEVQRIEPGEGQRLRVSCDRHAPILADRVVLALGNPPPPLLPWAEEVQGHPGYVHNPWELPPDLAPHHAVLIVGNGLTMADVVLALAHGRDDGPLVHTLSRRGLIPLPQSFHRIDPSELELQEGGEKLLAAAHSLRELLRTIRRLVAETEARGGDWRQVIQLVRHWAQPLWRALPKAERRRFVRHLLAFWSVHRHRQPPQSAERVDRLRELGRLEVKAGRVQKMAERDGRIKVWWEPRGAPAAECESLQVDWVINGLGPDYVLERSLDPLTQSLLKSGMIVADPLQLGLRSGEHGACIDRQGRLSERLFYLGPMLRADHWETTGAVELRQWAEDLAEHLRA
jgi:uncharacterized NAD(P)/FAD-binding protein YdhS